MSSLRVVLLSSCHHELYDYVQSSRHQLVGVIDQSRIFKPGKIDVLKASLGRPTNIELWCKKNKINHIHYAESEENLNAIRELKADILIVHFALFVSDSILSLFKYGGINFHPSLLPAYRGGSPLLWQAIDQEDYISGTYHHMTAVFDQGKILAQKSVPIKYWQSENVMFRKVREEIGIPLLMEILEDVDKAFSNAQTQPDKCSTRYASFVSSGNIFEKIKLSELSIASLFNLLAYCETWQPGLVKTSGVWKLFTWQPVHFDTSREQGNFQDGMLKLQRKGVKFFVTCNNGTITLKPQFHLKNVVKLLK